MVSFYIFLTGVRLNNMLPDNVMGYPVMYLLSERVAVNMQGTMFTLVR